MVPEVLEVRLAPPRRKTSAARPANIIIQVEGRGIGVRVSAAWPPCSARR
jgi:hypothetical protein